MNVLVLNCGAWWLKFAVVHTSNAHEHLAGMADGRITRTTSPMAAVVPTNEELMIAKDTVELVSPTPRAAA
jgi:acetate kinase